MIRDALAVGWKEWRELVRQRSTRLAGLVIIVIFGVVLPLNSRANEASSPFQVLGWAIIPFALTIPIIADAFAGERERHTLETLLATRLTETDILLGKLGMAVAYSFGGALLVEVLQTAVWSAREGALTMPPLDATLAGLVLAFSVALLTASVGILVSLRAATVRQAQQVLGLSFAALYVVAILLLTTDALASFRRSLLQLVAQQGAAVTTLAGAGVLLGIALALLVACRAAFQRQKLLLD